jgi:hypothetical protein
MPTVTLSLISQRSKAVPDAVRFVEIRGAGSGLVQPGDIDVKPGGEIVLDLVPDRYTIDVEVDGFVPTRGQLQVGFKAIARTFQLENLVTVLPKVSDLESEQRRLLQTLDESKKPGEIWSALTDNKSATFFQVTYALSEIALQDGTPLSSVIDRVVRVGGAQLTAPDTSGTSRTVIGWRMHVVFVGGVGIEELLKPIGFKRDTGAVHPTHARFGFVRSFRETGPNPRMQIVTNHEGTGADVDLDNGAFHRSSPHDIFKALVKRFPDVATLYTVK